MDGTAFFAFRLVSSSKRLSPTLGDWEHSVTRGKQDMGHEKICEIYGSRLLRSRKGPVMSCHLLLHSAVGTVALSLRAGPSNR